MESYLQYGLLLVLLALVIFFKVRAARWRKRDPTAARFFDAVEHAETFRRVDSAAADQMVAGAEAHYLERGSAELEELRTRAPTDLSAAKALRGHLVDTRKGLDVVRRYWEKQRGKTVDADAVLEALAVQHERLNEEIARLADQIARSRSSR